MGLIQVNFQVEDDLIKKIDDNCGDGGRSEFIREALREKLSRVNLENKEFNFLLREIKKIDPLAMHSDMKDLLLNTQIVFEEIKKQNEILKLIHRRSAIAATTVIKLWSVNKTKEEYEDGINGMDKASAAEITKIGL